MRSFRDAMIQRAGYVYASTGFPAPDFPALRGGSIHLWHVALDGAGSYHHTYRDLLSSDELERAHRFRFDRDRRRYIAGRVALRSILAGYLDRAPSCVRFSYGPHGKPTPAGETHLRFNLSHAAGRALVAVGAGIELGVDLEEHHGDVDPCDIAGRFFSPREYTLLLGTPESCRHELFYRIWVRKECYVKALGIGLSDSLHLFHVLEPVVRVHDGGASVSCDAEPWYLRDLDIGEGFSAALATAGPVEEVVTMEWRYNVPGLHRTR